MPITLDDGQIFYISTLKSITLNFLKELEDASAGKKTSLPFIHNTIPSTPLAQENEVFQVMVIGGSVYQQALAVSKENKLSFFEKKGGKLSTFKTKGDFISFIERNLDAGVGVVALNFAQPLEPVFVNNKLDGVLIIGAKEHNLTGLIGEQVGLELEKYFWEKYKRKLLFTVANDTVCLLLSGHEEDHWDRLAGGIVGTGVNFAFFIDEKTIVNLESRNFDKFPISKETREISLISKPSGVGLFGKETSGAYLYQHFNSIVKKQKLSHPSLSTTEELNEVAKREDGQASIIARGLIKKSAGLVASQIAGITQFRGHDMTFVMEGSLFWKADRYREYVDECLMMLAPEQKVSFVMVEDGGYLGAAKLVC